ncbi:MAG: hypothetical protein U0230_10285 [Polyangiales bacterium]
MGDAKRRGDFDTRAAAAKARLDALRPETITCNGCQRALAGVEQLRLKPLRGLDAVFVATCSDCRSETYVALGTDEAVQSFREFLARQVKEHR